jgi:DNA transposition AAA+ family ATPase
MFSNLFKGMSRLLAVPDPTTLIVVDEADHLAMNSLEQLRSIFDKSGLGMVRWASVGIHLPDSSPNSEVIAAVIRLNCGNFRLFVLLLTQMERVLAINGLQTLSVDVVETARENLVIRQA